MALNWFKLYLPSRKNLLMIVNLFKSISRHIRHNKFFGSLNIIGLSKWWMFVVTGVVAVLIALITVSFQSVKSAMVNPVKTLKVE